MKFKDLQLGEKFTLWSVETGTLHGLKLDFETAVNLHTGEQLTVHKNKGVNRPEGFDGSFRPAKYLGEMVLAQPATAERVYIMRATITHTESVSAKSVEYCSPEPRPGAAVPDRDNLAAVVALVGNEIARLAHLYEVLSLMLPTSDNTTPPGKRATMTVKTGGLPLTAGPLGGLSLLDFR